jgi:hypothetical protein
MRDRDPVSQAQKASRLQKMRADVNTIVEWWQAFFRKKWYNS